MDKRLSSSLELVVESWKKYLTEWNQAMRLSIWFLPAPLVFFATMFALRSVPNIAGPLVLPFLALTFCVGLWAEIRLTRWILASEHILDLVSNNQDEAMFSLRLIPGRLLVGFLSGLATLGGALAFVFPGIWLAVSLQFASMAYLSEGRRGMQALAASHALVVGRWWAVCKRLVIGGIFLVIGTYFVSSLIITILSFVSGSEALSAALEDGSQNPVYLAAQSFINGLYLMVFLPLFTRWIVRFYAELKKTVS